MSILVTSDVQGLFRENFDSAVKNKGVQASSAVKEYLVGVLTDYAFKNSVSESLEKPLTLQLNEALLAPSTDRLEKLRQVGDGSLYVTGFFREHLEKKGVDIGYVARVGATAYGSAAALLTPADTREGGGLFRELADCFEKFVDVIRDVAESFMVSGANSPGDIVRLYERWLRTGSSRIALGLGAKGLMPLKPVGGTQ